MFVFHHALPDQIVKNSLEKSKRKTSQSLQEAILRKYGLQKIARRQLESEDREEAAKERFTVHALNE